MKNDDDNNNKKQYDESLWTAFAVPTQVVIYIVGGAALGIRGWSLHRLASLTPHR